LPQQKEKEKKVPNPLNELLLIMVINEKNPKVRRLMGIATFVGEMVKWSLNVLKIWNP
jgi:hypothetical protein